MVRPFFKNLRFLFEVDRLSNLVASYQDEKAIVKFKRMYRNLDEVEKNPKILDFYLIGLFVFSSLVDGKPETRKIFLEYISVAKRQSYYNEDERNFLDRYALAMLNISRDGSDSSLIASTAKNLKIEMRNVRRILRNCFSVSPFSLSPSRQSKT